LLGWSCYKYIVASLCAGVRFFGSAFLRMGALAAGFLFLPGADWSGALVSPGVAGWSVAFDLVLSHTTMLELGTWVVGGALCTRVMGPVVLLA
jgi:hypothetical protein